MLRYSKPANFVILAFLAVFCPKTGCCFEKIVKKIEDIQCKDKSICDDESTCCQMASGEYGCCPMPQAVCCSDNLHCCPENTICNLKEMRCVDPSTGAYVARLLEKIAKKPKLRGVRCDDKTNSTCPHDSTCCKMASGKFGCCPMEEAVCCPDMVHCCPSGTTCDPEARGCLGRVADIFVPWSLKFEAHNEATDSILCGDRKSKCPDDTTCCKLASGRWGCCPMPNAVCCMDGVHCCPESTTCNLEEGRCEQKTPQRKLLPARAASNNEQNYGHVFCSTDPAITCPDNSTCCKESPKKWGCCQMPDAVCCQDGQHCCPKSTMCDMAKKRCVHNDVRALWSQTGVALTKISTTMTSWSKRNIIGQKLCPDQKQECPKTETCCLYNSKWSCCPFPEAICCPDGHCCPKGEKCGTGGQACVSDPTSKTSRST